MSQIMLISRASRVLSVSGAAVRTELSGTVLQPQGNHTSIRTMASEQKKALTMETINPHVKKLQYAVRGPLVAAELQKEMDKGAKKLLKRMTKANIGDAHAMGQKPITFIRQVVACVSDPTLLEYDLYPSDVKERAKGILAACAGQSVGAYTMSYGIELIRRHVAEYIERRDGHKANWQDICLSGGATGGIKSCLQLLCNHKVDGKDTAVLIPIPRYPLYSASLAEYGLEQVGYYLHEGHKWAVDINELERAFTNGSKTHAVRAIVVINPGNPIGQVLTRSNIEDIIKFAQEHSLFVFADEVYQDNVYDKDSKFYSFKKVMMEMGAPYNTVELASFMSISKGYVGECGLRGAWMELCNLDPEVQAHLYKAISAMLCSTTLGQIALDCVVKPPKPGEPSYELWHKEKTAIMESLKKRAQMIATFNPTKNLL